MTLPSNSTSANQLEILKGAFVNFLSYSGRVFKFLFLVFITRLFGVEILAAYVLGFSLIDALSKVSGFEWYILQTIVEKMADNKLSPIRSFLGKIIVVSIIFNVIFSIVVFYFAQTIAITIFNQEDLAPTIALMAFSIPLMAVVAIFNFSFLAIKKVKYMVFIQSVVDPTALLVCSLVAYFISKNTSSVIFAMLVSQIITILFCIWIFLSSYPSSHDTTDPINWRGVFSYSTPMGLSEFMNVLKNKIDVIVLARFLPPTQIGIYVAAVEISSVLKKIRFLFEPIFLPIASSLYAAKNFTELDHQYKTSTRWIIMITLPVLSLYLLFPEFFLHLFSPEFSAGSPALIILSIGTAIMTCMGMSEPILSLKGHAHANLITSFTLILISGCLLFTLIPLYGINGAALSIAIAYSLVSFLKFLYIKRFVTITPFSTTQQKPFFAAIVTIACIYPLTTVVQIHSSILIPVTILINILLQKYIFRPYNEDIKVLSRFIQPLKNFLRKI